MTCCEEHKTITWGNKSKQRTNDTVHALTRIDPGLPILLSCQVHHVAVNLHIPPSEHDNDGVHDASPVLLVRAGNCNRTIAGREAGEVGRNINRIKMHKAVSCEVGPEQQENGHMEHDSDEMECPLHQSDLIEEHQKHGKDDLEKNVAPRKDKHHPVMITDETKQALPHSTVQLALAEVTPQPRSR